MGTNSPISIVVWKAAKGGAIARRLWGRGPFEVDSFHATTSKGIMLNVKNIAGDRPPPVPRGAAAHVQGGKKLREHR